MRRTRIHPQSGKDVTGLAYSMEHAADLVLPCLDCAEARLVLEVGAFQGEHTRVLLDWAELAGARVATIDPSPHESLEQLARERTDLELIRATSLEALPRVEMPDAVIIDGDHNYWTVSRELRLLAERANGANLPLLILHDVCWPHGRRDDYYEADAIPEEYRRPVAGNGRGLFPGEPGLRRGGLPYPRSATTEGGSRNGVLTAVEDFVAEREGLRLAVVPVFFGFGFVWDREAPWAEAMAEILDPWDRNPLLARLEANRVHHLAESHSRLGELWRTQERLRRLEAVLQRMLRSSAFSVAERLSRLRMRARVAPEQEVVSKQAIRRALDANGGADGAIEGLASANGSDGEAARSSARSSSQ